MQRNKYPNEFINSIIQNVNVTRDWPPPPRNVTRKKEKFFSIPYIGPASNTIKKHLCNLDKNIRIAFSGHNLNKKFFSKTKDPVPLGKCSGLVYSVPCNDCEGNYVGETGQLLEKRVAQHKNDIKNKRKSAALCKHATELGHSFDFGNTSILCFENNEKNEKLEKPWKSQNI